MPENRRRTLLDFLFVILGKFSMIGVILLGGVIIARTGGPAEYGLFILIVSSALLIDGVLGTSLDLAVIRYASGSADVARGDVIRCQAFAFHVKWGVVAGLLMAWLLLSRFGPGHSLTTYPVLSTLLVSLGLLVSRSVLVDAQVQKHFRIYSSIDGLQGLIRMVLFGALWWAGCSKAIYFLGVYGGTGFLALLGGVFILRQRFITSPLPSREEMVGLFRFAGAMTFIIACGTLTGRGDIILLSFAESKESLAHYGAASQVVQLLTQMALYASVLTQPRILQELRQGTLTKLLMANVVAVAMISLLSIVIWKAGLMAWGIQLLFGEAFLESVPLLQIQFAGGLLDLLLVPVLVTLGVLVAPRACAWGELAITLLFFAGGLLIITHVPAGQTSTAMSWAFVGVRLAKLVFYALLCLRIFLGQFRASR